MSILNIKAPSSMMIGQRYTDLPINPRLSKFVKGLILFLVLLLIAVIGIFDYKTEESISFYVFYSLPIFISAWYIGGWAGVVASLASSVAWWLVDLKNIQTLHFVQFAGGIIRLIYFVGISIAISFLRVSFIREKHLAETDFLTGLPNRRTFIEKITLEIERAKRYGRCFTIAYIDLDNFKEVNDHHGHAVGDKLLKEIAVSIRNDVRPNDLVARLGGDEFLVFFPNTTEDEGLAALTHLQSCLNQISQHHKLPVTSTIGAITYNKTSLPPEELIKSADRIMYSGKHAGRNTIQHVTENNV